MSSRGFNPNFGADWSLGVVGPMQVDGLADRIRTEYEVPLRFEPTSLLTARWVEADDSLKLKRFLDTNQGALASDHTGAPVFLARNAWHLDRAAEDWPDLRFLKTKERSEEHTSELQSLMRISYAVFCLNTKKNNTHKHI